MVILVAVIGLVVGSFVNAAVWRIHDAHEAEEKGHKQDPNRSLLTGRSMCPHCNHQLEAKDLVPVFSWLTLGGKCRYCGKPISVQYPVVELITSILFVVSYYCLQPTTWHLFFWFYILMVFMILAIYDLKWMILPDVVLLPTIVVVLLFQAAEVVGGHPVSGFFGPVIAALGAGAGFYLLALITRGKGMGGGDIKLVFLMGLLLGVQRTALALFVGFVTASIVGVGMIIAAKVAKKKRPRYIAFGPYLIFGTIVAMLAGTQIINWYLSALV